MTSDFYPAGRDSHVADSPPPPSVQPEHIKEQLSPSPPVIPVVRTPRETPRRSDAVKFDFTGARAEGTGIVESTLMEEFRLHGYRVLDRSAKAPALMIKGTFRVTQSPGPPPYDAIMVSHADVSARIIRDGEIIASASVPVGKAFDRSGGAALEAATHMLAVKLIDNIDKKSIDKLSKHDRLRREVMNP